MTPAPYPLLGTYASLSRRLTKLPAGTTAAKKARAAAVSALEDQHESLITAHQKLLDAHAEYEAAAAAAVSHVNKSLATLRRSISPLPPVADHQIEAAMHEGAHHLGSIARQHQQHHHDHGDHLEGSSSGSSSNPSRGL